jgi:hypothetical protein
MGDKAGIRSRCFGLTLLAAALSGCASAPVQEMSDARQALQAAAAVSAPTKAPNAFIKATAHVRHAEIALKNGDYKDAREHATWAKMHALDARARALNLQLPLDE